MLRGACSALAVETGSQSLILNRLGCHRVQGYLYSPPLPAVAITARLSFDVQTPHVPARAGTRPTDPTDEGPR